VIIGGVWSKTDTSPEPNEDGKNNFRGYRSRSGHRLILDDSSKTKVVIADKTAKNMIGVGSVRQGRRGPNVCAIYKPPMSGTTGVAVSTIEGKLEVSCPERKLSVTADDCIKNQLEDDDRHQGRLRSHIDGSSNTKISSASPSSYDASKIDIA